MAWSYDKSSNRYRNDATGRYMSNAQMLSVRDAFIDKQKTAVRQLANDLAERRITVQEWTVKMRSVIKTTILDEYLLGIGGRNMATSRDYGRVGALVKDQYAFLNNFANDILNNASMTEDQIGARSEMYVSSGTESFEIARVKSYSQDLDLPQYPGDGQTVCLTNCKCHWRIEDNEDSFVCNWIVYSKEPCGDCEDAGSLYSPLVVAKTENRVADVIQIREMLDSHGRRHKVRVHNSI